MSSTAFKTSKVLEKSTLAKTKVILRRSTRKGAGKRPPTFFEEYSKDIMAVYMEGEDHEEVLKALKEEDSVDYKSNKDEAYEDDSTLDESSSDEGEVES